MIEIVPFRPEWADEFATIAAELRAALRGLAIRIDHIGSTAVPGLAAKDVIDVQVTVDELSDDTSQALTELGYVRANDIAEDHRPPGARGVDSDWEKWFFYAPKEQRPTNTHVRVEGRPNQRYSLVMRDYLRLHRSTADAYGELKQRLAASLAQPLDYPHVKDPAADLIYLAADRWAHAVRWEPGPSDA